MHIQYSHAKRVFLFSCLMLWVPGITTAVSQTYTISGIVSAEKCPVNPAMEMPCTLSPMPGCTVSVSPVYATTSPGTYNLPNIWIRNSITDANGTYSITFDAQPGLIVNVAAAKAGVGAATPVEVPLVKQSITVNLVLQDVVITPPPTQGTATLQGTVYGTSCPPATTPPMGMPCSRNPVPQCTVVVTPMVIPMLYPTPPQYLPHTIMTDANGQYSLGLPAGDYIVTAQKSGSGSVQANATLTANQTITLDLTLAAKDTIPLPPTGKASVQGTVKEIINPPNPAMGMVSVVQPVPGCTVLVCSAVLPLMYSESASGSVPGAVSSAGSTASEAPAVLIAQQYIAITDTNGHYSFKDIPLYGKTYSVVLMAKKRQKFGDTQADLVNGQTATADIIISEAVPVASTDTSTILTGIYQQYFAAVAATLSPQNPAAIIVRSYASNRVAADVHFSGSCLLINLQKSQRLTVKAFTLDGKTIAVFANNRFFGAGVHVLPIMATYSGPMLIQVQGENVSYIVKVNPLRHR